MLSAHQADGWLLLYCFGLSFFFTPKGEYNLIAATSEHKSTVVAMTQQRLTQILFPPVEGNDDTDATPPPPPLLSPFSYAAGGSRCAGSRYSRWSSLFGNGPDHVTTKWWKLWAVCKLSISIEERLGEKEIGRDLGSTPDALRRRSTDSPSSSSGE